MFALVMLLSLALHPDHVPIAVRDLPAAVAEFRALGFTIKPGRPHPGGIENASIKFADGSYVELITSHGAGDALSREYQDFLSAQEGAAYTFLRDEPNGAFTSEVLRSGGRREEAGPFAFTDLPASWNAPRLQLIEYLAPAVDPPATFEHANGARRVAAIWTFVDHAGDPIVKALDGHPADLGRIAFEDRPAESAALADGTRLMFVPRRPGDPPRSTALAILIEVDSIDRLPRAWRSRTIARGPARWLPPAQIHGVWLGFIEREAWTIISAR